MWHARATRPLLDGSDGAGKPKLSEEQRAKLDSRRTFAQRKARAARALLAADLADEAAPALREAVLAHAQAAEIAHHRPESATLAEALRPPCAVAWPAEIRSAVQALDASTIMSDLATVLVVDKSGGYFFAYNRARGCRTGPGRTIAAPPAGKPATTRPRSWSEPGSAGVLPGELREVQPRFFGIVESHTEADLRPKQPSKSTELDTMSHFEHF